MQIHVKTDSHVKGGKRLNERVEAVLERALNRFADRITRIEVHVTDESSGAKISDNDKRCVMEARIAGLNPIAVSHESATVDQAVDGAADKLHKSIERTVQRLGDRKGQASFGGDQTI